MLADVVILGGLLLMSLAVLAGSLLLGLFLFWLQGEL